MSFVSSIKKEYDVQKHSILSNAITIACMYMLGIFISVIVAAIAKESVYAPTSMILATFGVLLVSVIVATAQLNIGYNYAVSMGVTRKRYFISFLVTSVLSAILYVAELAILLLLDKLIAGTLFSNWEYIMNDVTAMMKVSSMLIIVLVSTMVLIAVGVFIAAVIKAGGRKAFWVLWSLWMIGCFLLPTAVSNMDNNIVGKLVYSAIMGLVQMQIWQLALLGGGVASGCLFLSWLVFRKATVEV